MNFEDIYDRYKQDVFQYLYSLTGARDEAEELLAETFFRAFVGFGTFRGEASVKTWLFAIARHVFYQHLSKEKKYVSVEETVLYQMCVQAGMVQPDVENESELAELVSRLLAQKDERSRTVFHMRLEGYSFKEIGEKVGISENSARVVEHRVRMYLQKELRKEGYGHE